MDCERMRFLLDAYIDGELSAEEMYAVSEHAKSCEACKRELETAELLRDTLMHMDEDISVPLEAQAAWRSAVRAEARKKNTRKLLRTVYAAAAALVVFVGCMAAFRNAPEPAGGLNPELNAAARTLNLIEADGGVQAGEGVLTEASGTYTAWKKILTEDADKARQTIEDLAAEYNGSFSFDGAAICRIELPYDYMVDFLNASSRIGEETYSEISDTETDTAVILIQLLTE